MSLNLLKEFYRYAIKPYEILIFHLLFSQFSWHLHTLIVTLSVTTLSASWFLQNRPNFQLTKHFRVHYLQLYAIFVQTPFFPPLHHQSFWISFYSLMILSTNLNRDWGFQSQITLSLPHHIHTQPFPKNIFSNLSTPPPSAHPSPTQSSKGSSAWRTIGDLNSSSPS
jgi:hypothetical protein